jgi:hypothetical protein
MAGLPTKYDMTLLSGPIGRLTGDWFRIPNRDE